jgi:2,4-dienoyl-CoA reductase-like NADH-dependent reductase (Old Yellow Enzyme family)
LGSIVKNVGYYDLNNSEITFIMALQNSLFQPFYLGNLSLENRIIMAPMTRNFSPNDNIPRDNIVDYYRRRAEGGVGLIITEGTCVGHRSASGYPSIPYFHGEARLAGWKKVVDTVHAAGGKIAPQLWHVGAVRKSGTMPEGDVPGYGPSGMNVPGKVNRHVMTQQYIDDVVETFAQAASDAKDVGFDAVELHGAHGYLFDQFFWEGTNQRDDQYADFTPKPGEMTSREADTASLDTLLHRLDNQEFDLVAVGRALIANPDWVNLVKAKRMDDLKPFHKEHLGELI